MYKASAGEGEDVCLQAELSSVEWASFLEVEGGMVLQLIAQTEGTKQGCTAGHYKTCRASLERGDMEEHLHSGCRARDSKGRPAL